MKVNHYFPFRLEAEPGDFIDFRIKRMTIDEHAEFSARLEKMGTPTAQRFVSRATTGPEQDRITLDNGASVYAIDFAALAAQKVEALSGDERAAYKKQEAEDTQAARESLSWVMENFVTVASGLIEVLPDGSEKTITEGIDITRVFGGRADLLLRVLEAVRVQNELTEKQKKSWKSRFDSSPTSTEPKQDPPGPKLETIAPDVETEDSAPTADASEKDPSLSGSTDQLPYDHAPY